MARKSHLYSFHEQNGKLTEFSGFDMPLWYRGIIEEHNAVRNAAGLFDVSHMGRFSIKGNESTSFLNHVLPSDAKKVKENRAFYSTICNEKGGIIDDTVTNKLSENEYLMVVNAGNREKDWNWLEKHAEKFSVEMADLSDSIALIAFQGPLSLSLLQKSCDIDLSSLKRFGLAYCNLSETRCLISRTGYTGEDGFEIAVLDCPLYDPEKALKIWNNILEIGKDRGVLPCGLGARDSLRLEAGMCLYGNDIDDTTTPVEADLEFIISTEKNETYLGEKVIRSQLKNGTIRTRIAFSMQSGIPRHGFDIKLAGSKVGTVTSGTFSPIVKKGIGMGYVPPELSENGRTVSVQIRSAEQPANIVSTPFYDQTKYGYKRSKI
ncbi:MAG: glycine cleavage system aminomethyltransferase GcvT [archaeon]|nr:glycine cleavage system aminomethyltransferase GcvT [archaeon]